MEDQDHFLFTCLFAAACWGRSKFSTSNGAFLRIVQHQQLFSITFFNGSARLIWSYAVGPLLRKLWYGRDKRVLHLMTMNLIGTFPDLVKLFAFTQCSASQVFCNFDLSHIYTS